MRTLYLTGVPQFVKLVDLSYNLDLLFDTDDIGTFELRDVSHYLERRRIALDFNSSFDAFAAQARLNGYVYALPNGQEYVLNAKLAKENMALRRVCCRWRSPSPVEMAGRDWDANDAIAVLPTMSEGVLERAHAKLDAQLDLLKKQKLILKAQKKVLKAKKKLDKEYSKVDGASEEEPTSSGHNPLPRDPSRSKSKTRVRRWSPVNSPGTPPIETTTNTPTKTKEKKTTIKKAKKTCKRRARSRKRSQSKDRDPFHERSRSKNRQRSTSKIRRSSSKNRRSRSRSQRSCSGSQRRSRSKNRWSSSKNRRPAESRRSPSHYCRSRSRSRDARIGRRSITRDWSRSRTLRSPEFSRNRSRSRDRVYTRRQQLIGKVSVSSLPSSEPYTRQLAIMPAPIQDSQSIFVERKISAVPVIDYISNNTVTNFHESSSSGMRYRCTADKDETVSKCTELYYTNNIVIMRKKLTDEEKDKEDNNIKENRVETSVGIPEIQTIRESNEKKCDDVVELDNSVQQKPLAEILLGICKESSLNTDPISAYDQKDLASQLAGDVNNIVSSCYLDNKPHVSELAIKEETNKDSNLNWQEISTMDTNIDEDVNPIPDLANIPEVIKLNAEYPLQQMHHQFLNDDFNIDVDVKSIIDMEKIPQLKEINEELSSLLDPFEFVVNEDSNIDELVTQLEEIHGVIEIKKSPLLPKRPKFVIIIQHLMKEMGASIRKVKQDFMKMSFQTKLKYVLRVMLREIVLGKGRMTKAEIMRSFRDRYPREQDDEFARRVVEGIQAGKYGNLGPSDDELSDDNVGDDLVLVENEHETIVISDSDDDSGVPKAINVQNSRRLAWAEWARARGLTAKTPPKVVAPNLMMPRVLIPYPTSMGPLPDQVNKHEVTEVKIENNDIVPEFTDTELENLRKCIEKVDPGTADPRDGTETPHVTGITIMTSLSELFSLKTEKQVPTKEEKEIKIENDSLTEEYIKDAAEYYNPYKD